MQEYHSQAIIAGPTLVQKIPQMTVIIARTWLLV